METDCSQEEEMTISNERKQLVYDWLDTAPEQRTSEKEFRQSLRLGYRTFKNLRIEWQVEKTLENKREVQLAGAYGAIEKQMSDPVNIAEDGKRWTAMEQAIYQKGLDGTVKAQELYARLKGKLKDEIEVTIGLSADEIARRNLEAERELREAGYRMEEVQEEPPLLSE